MDHLVFYKKEVSLKDKLRVIRFSHSYSYRNTYVTSRNQLISLLGDEDITLLHYFCDVLGIQERQDLLAIKKLKPDIKICLCTNAHYALDGWQLGLYHFIAQPITDQNITNAYKKLNHFRESSVLPKSLPIKTDEGLVKIPIENICYLKASGNYTYIYVTNDTRYIVTKQLSNFKFLNDMFLHFDRVHRSIIINKEKIKEIESQSIKFFNTNAILDISISLAKRLKSDLLSIQDENIL